MSEAERLAERLLDLVSNFTKQSYRDTLTNSATLIRQQSARIAALEDALRDCSSGLEYIRQHYGELSGVGFDRALTAAAKALGKGSE